MAVDRNQWIAVLAKAPEELLEGLWAAAGITASFEWLRWPETSAVLSLIHI